MKSRNWFVLFAIVATLLGGLQACGDDDTCTECWCDPAYCDGGDADADADGDAATTAHLTVTSVPVPAESVEINGATDPLCSATPCELDLPVRSHDIHLSATGRLHLPDPVTVNLPPEGIEVNIFLGWDLTGRWQRGSDGREVTVEMWHRDRIMAWPPTTACPYTELVVHGFSPLGAICLEHDDTLSLCRDHTSECGGDWAEGQILDSGRRVQFTHHWETPTPGEQTFIYTKLD
jgi:hypothetical protein